MNISGIDWEHEAQKDAIYALERQKDLEATWQKECETFKINVHYETKRKAISFRRTVKKILLSRSRIPAEAYY